MEDLTLRMQDQEEEETDNSGQIWLTVYCDLMTNLMLFFLMLYSLTRITSEQKNGIVDSLRNKYSNIEISQNQVNKIVNKFQENMGKEKIENLVESDELKNETKMEVTEKTVKVTLNVPVFFDSGEATVKEAAYRPLYQIGLVLKGLSNKIIIEGHTDNIPIPAGKSNFNSNWELSVARAGSVIEFYTKKMGIPGSRFLLAGYGEFKPVADNSTPEGRMKNRRIEINIIRHEK